jgi:uncharacterized membrane protein
MAYIAASVILGFFLPNLEHNYIPREIAGMSVASAQAFLSAVTSGMMALTGIVFSIAFLILQFTGGAYSPRLVALIGRDPTLFSALGIFIATFTYSLATLAWVDRNGDGKVPFYSVMLVLALLVTSMYFLARIVQRIGILQISHVLIFVGNAGRTSIRETLLPIDAGRDTDRDQAGALDRLQLDRPTQVIRYDGDPRYVVYADFDALADLAARAGAVFVAECAIGDAIDNGTPLVKAYEAKQRLPEEPIVAVFHLGEERRVEFDPKYALRILVDVAIKALSPAINDPTTAVQAIHQIEDLLARIERCNLRAGVVNDSEGNVRVVFPAPTWEDYLRLGFDEIRSCGASQVQVVRRLNAALKSFEENAPTQSREQAVRRYRESLDRSVDAAGMDPEDLAFARRQDRQGLGVSRP